MAWDKQVKLSIVLKGQEMRAVVVHNLRARRKH